MFFNDRDLMLAKHSHTFRLGLECPHTYFFLLFLAKNLHMRTRKEAPVVKNKHNAFWAQKEKDMSSVLKFCYTSKITRELSEHLGDSVG